MKQLIMLLVVVALVGGGGYLYVQNAKKEAGKTPVAPATSAGKNNAGASNAGTTKTGAPAATEKSGTTTKTGKISLVGERFYLQEAGSTPKEIDSYVVDLNKYVDQTVTVSGQYSGDTLFVGSVK